MNEHSITIKNVTIGANCSPLEMYGEGKVAPVNEQQLHQ